MEVLAIGFMRMDGKAAATGRPYDMASLSILLPQSGFQNANGQRVVAGYTSAEMEVDVSQWAKFMGLPYPCHLKLDVKEEMRVGKGNRAETKRVVTAATVVAPLDIAHPSLKKPATTA